MGHFKTLEGYLHNHSFIVFVVYLGSLSCSKVTLDVFLPYFGKVL